MARKDPVSPLPVLVDSDVVIDFLRGKEGARSYLNRIPFGLRRTSDLVWLEVLRGARNGEEVRLIDRFFGTNFPEVLAVSEAVSRRSIQLLREYGLSVGLGPVDLLLAGTAIVHGMRLGTGNARHFSRIGGLDLLAYRPS